MKHIIFPLVFALITSTITVSAQNSVNGSVLFENDVVSIVSKQSDCVSQKNGTAKVYLLLELANKSDEIISVTSQKNMWYDGKCIGCDSESEEYLINEQLNPHETISGDCELNSQLRVFVRMMELKNVSQLTFFELKDTQVTTH